MSEKTTWILISAVVILFAFFIFRKTLKKLWIKVSGEGVEAQLETRKNNEQNSPTARYRKDAGIVISKNSQFGIGNSMEVESNRATVEENKQVGKEQKIIAKDSKPTE